MDNSQNVVRRQNTVNNNDRRVKKTKKNLRDCLIKLLDEKSINRITVRELTDMADVNRSTFYFYYEDIYDMLAHIQEEIYEVFKADVINAVNDFEDVGDYTEYTARFLDFCRENYDVCRFVMSNDCNNQLSDKIKRALMQNLPDSTKVYPPTDARYYLTAYAMSAIFETILIWMNDGMKVDSHSFAEFLCATYVFGSVRIKGKSLTQPE